MNEWFWVLLHSVQVSIENFVKISGCACIHTVKKHALISEGVLIFECFVQ